MLPIAFPAIPPNWPPTNPPITVPAPGLMMVPKIEPKIPPAIEPIAFPIPAPGVPCSTALITPGIAVAAPSRPPVFNPPFIAADWFPALLAADTPLALPRTPLPKAAPIATPPRTPATAPVPVGLPAKVSRVAFSLPKVGMSSVSVKFFNSIRAPVASLTPAK